MKPLNVALSVFLTMLLGIGVADSAPSQRSIISKLLGSSSPKESSSTKAPASIETQIEELRKKVASAEVELAELTRDSTAKSLTAGASQEEIAERQILLQQFIRLCLQNIDGLIKLSSLQQARTQLESQVEQWGGLPEPPPYSFRTVDALRGAQRSLQIRLQSVTQLYADVQQETDNRSDRLKTASEKHRQAEERMEEKSPVDNTARLSWRRDQALWRMQVAEASLGTIKAEQSQIQEDLAEIRLQLALTEKKLSAASQHVVYPEADRNAIRRLIKAEQQRLQAELDLTTGTLVSSRKKLDAAMQAHAQAQVDGGVHSAEDFSLELQQVQTENADINFRVLNLSLGAINVRQGFHELRWSLVGSEDAEKIRQAYERIDKAQTEMTPIKDYIEQRLKLAGNSISDLEKKTILAVTPQERAHYQRLIELYNQRQAAMLRALSGIDITEQLLEFFKQDLDERGSTESLSDRIDKRLAQIKDVSTLVWQFELFAVEDSIDVDGQTITGKRSVTVGKVSTAILILLIGFWIAVRLSRGMEHMAVKRVGMDASYARIARRWVLLILGLMLVVTSLEMVKIPLTVFAFMGGVLAIGSGFAMQNLLKNLISGLMLLLERPFRPGDLVEVGGIRGRVMDIGMRSSHIRDGNGIETVIPNSTFVEQNVTNWTLSSQSVRIAVKIGIAYGSSVREVADLLIAVANQHGLVQDTPAPQVLFEDFGSDALLLGLYVWVELKPEVDWRTIASDLRYMMIKALTAKGIVIAYPQRDVHLDSTRPLEVRVLAQGVDDFKANGQAMSGE